jgi:hypothetical protein
MSKGQFEIINNEGMICYVNTDKKDSEFYGKVWSDICKSKLEGIVIDGIIDRYQYRTMNGEPVSDKPTGFIVKIQDKVEAFLPMSNAAWRNSEEDGIGTRIAIMVQDFDPMSRSIILKELRTAYSGFDIEKINTSLELIGNAYNEGKFIRGTILDEKTKNGSGCRAGYLVTINGLEAFLPSSLSHLPNDNIKHLVGHNILAGIQAIDVDKMSIILTMQLPYQKLIAGLPSPMIGKTTSGILSWVTLYNAYVLLPEECIGIIPRYKYPELDLHKWKDKTGTVIDCVPYREKFSNNSDPRSYYIQ